MTDRDVTFDEAVEAEHERLLASASDRVDLAVVLPNEELAAAFLDTATDMAQKARELD